MEMDLQLTGKVAVITGSGRGIGYASALALAQEGARIVITDINPESVEQAVGSLKQAGHEAIGAVLDVCDPEQVQTMAELAAHAFGGIDILVNNAGFTRDKYLLKMPVEDWDSVVDTILKGAYYCTKAALPSMMERKWGRVINIASRAHWGNPGQTNYSAAKAGLIGFTRALALEQGKFNITANAIAPGLIETPLVRGLSTYETLRANALARQPVPRLGAVEDIANAVAFLASERSSFITGELLHVTGGRYAS
ncbi:3-oxoacyl-[acyl-carrier-protein] reductase FabG [Achromobacter piechaudii]|jgi:3-oxoacyl-[acyl-carrier protein] reductase|uniref:3-oxoacyl-[acyl-carrier-protein] reductase FabG n=2 Tax=Alcaligenaceae TaxID=506 RepID=A0ABN7F7D7_9BURK|nr:3-oxoacyl-[acyl-carrier-protein] reductase FabG [Achromobacter piechaudii]CAB3920956.1 3-oxoacyl-[acyl-carrier-protein] reductase FabG [Achromobacter piechaudii]CAB3958505.1 3-oxoacyl-[acyl-carrier-protein] reductase FabG [Achromobacter piechaudii]